MKRRRTTAGNRRLRNRARILKALAHPSRLLMVEELAGGEKCVCELQAAVGADISTVSKHLAVMKRAGLVQDGEIRGGGPGALPPRARRDPRVRGDVAGEY
ncbi:MAG: winged helix-turn-helix transcriptional regulator [Kiritimatiellae bacterium]|nr:winged helix-turn-helix transcriptional regulator [Kiritimatiellia bacterium]